MNRVIAKWVTSQKTQQAAMASAAVRDLVSRYVPGRTIPQILPVLQDLHRKGLAISLDYLGAAHGRENFEHNLATYRALIDQLTKINLNEGAELSVRLASFGVLDGAKGQELAKQRLRQICQWAGEAGAMVTIGMGSSSHTDAIMTAWEELRQDHDRLGITIQAQLVRSISDLTKIADSGTRIRLVKGAAIESGQVAYRRAHDIDRAYVKALRQLMGTKATVLVGTHDPRIISIAETLVQRTGRHREDHEFQMVYAVRPLEQRRLVDIGHISRVYIPFGPGGFGYYLPRVLERPATAALFLRSLIGKR